MDECCPVCSTKNSYAFLERNNVPAFQNIVIDNEELASRYSGSKLLISACPNCGFIYNREFEPSNVDYNILYENCQLHSKYFNNHINNLIYRILEKHKIRNSQIIEIGCGQGEFITKVVEKTEYGNYGIGFDPSYRGQNTDVDGRLKFYNDYYDDKFAHIKADVIICRHVIEHIKEPVAFLNTIRQAVKSEHTLLFFETPCVNWIINNNAFWDFFYEHCSYFNMNSIKMAFTNAGFIINAIEHIFKGQYLWVEARLNSSKKINAQDLGLDWQDFKNSIDKYVKKEQQMLYTWNSIITTLNEKNNKVAVWGGGQKV